MLQSLLLTNETIDCSDETSVGMQLIKDKEFLFRQLFRAACKLKYYPFVGGKSIDSIDSFRRRLLKSVLIIAI